jgi:hypothetical protein
MMDDHDRQIVPNDQHADAVAGAAALRNAAAELHAAIDRVTTAKLTASPINMDEAQNQFEIALANFSSHLDARTA